MTVDQLCRLLRLPTEDRHRLGELLAAMERREAEQAGDDRDIPADITPERRAKAGGAIEGFVSESGRRTARLLDGSLLNLLLSRGKVDEEHYAAGCQFYTDWYNAGLASSGVVDLSRIRVDCGSAESNSDKQFAALWACLKAILAVGPHLGDILMSLVAFEESRVSYSLRKFGVSREDKANATCNALLLIALDALLNHYRGPQRPRRGGIRHSGVAGYRPALQPADDEGA